MDVDRLLQRLEAEHSRRAAAPEAVGPLRWEPRSREPEPLQRERVVAEAAPVRAFVDRRKQCPLTTGHWLSKIARSRAGAGPLRLEDVRALEVQPRAAAALEQRPAPTPGPGSP